MSASLVPKSFQPILISRRAGISAEREDAWDETAELGAAARPEHRHRPADGPDDVGPMEYGH
eukprot:4064440-Alexandrium_andersonii.AAC.1